MALTVEGVKEDDLRIMEEQSGNFSQVEEKEARAPDSQKDMGLTLDRVKDDLRITADQSGDDAKLERLISVAVERVEKEAPTAPENQKDLAALMFLSFLFHYGLASRRDPISLQRGIRSGAASNREALEKDSSRSHPGGWKLIMRWPWSTREKRQASYSEAVSNALLAVASGVGNLLSNRSGRDGGKLLWERRWRCQKSRRRTIEQWV